MGKVFVGNIKEPTPMPRQRILLPGYISLFHCLNFQELYCLAGGSYERELLIQCSCLGAIPLRPPCFTTLCAYSLPSRDTKKLGQWRESELERMGYIHREEYMNRTGRSQDYTQQMSITCQERKIQTRSI